MRTITNRYRSLTGAMLIVAAAMMSACGAGTPLNRGVSETQMGAAQYKIEYTQKGPVFTQAQAMLQARAAEITLARGYRFFTARWAIEDERFVYECLDGTPQKGTPEDGKTLVVMRPFERTESLTITLFKTGEAPPEARYSQVFDALKIQQHFGQVADRTPMQKTRRNIEKNRVPDTVTLLSNR